MSSYNFSDGYSDLACERYRADTELDGVSYKKETTAGGIWERINISSLAGAKSIGRPMGMYHTLGMNRMDLLDSDFISDAKRELAGELCFIFKKMNILPRRILVVGLGNPKLTPDAVGASSVLKIKPTLHIKKMDERFFNTLECSEIAVIAPGVSATTGLESSVTVCGICEKIKPNAVIAIDALAARDVERLGSTVQISSTGIVAGSGLGSCGTAINEELVGVPVIAVGVPTVISSAAFCPDNSAQNKEFRTQDTRGGMFVSPKEINEIVEVASEIISGGINTAFGLSY